MENMLENTQEIISVTEVNKRAKNILENKFSKVWIEGEISSFTSYSSGHWYFTIKDKASALNCVMLSYENKKILFEPKTGDHLILNGKVSIYQPTGKYQLNVSHIELAGEGALIRAFEDLKKSLEQEGLFDNNIKKSIPQMPQHIAVVTSPDGAVFKDIINVMSRRAPAVKITLIPSLVQGEKSHNQITRAIKIADKIKSVDIVIVARGGGSIEDLWSFNTEDVIRAIHECKKPIISAIGHETDFTIADFVSDLRAPTPSAAAEIISQGHSNFLNDISSKFNRLNQKFIFLNMNRQDDLDNLNKRLRHPKDKLREVSQNLDEINNNLNRVFLNAILIKKNSLKFSQKSLIQFSPVMIFEKLKSRLDLSKNQLKNNIFSSLKLNKTSLLNLTSTLEAVSPLAVLNRGFSLLTTDNQSLITSSLEVKQGDEFNAQLKQGTLRAKVIETKDNEK